MMLRDAFGLALEADWVEQSLLRVLSGGYRTADISEPGARTVTGSAFIEMLRDEMHRTLEHAERYGWGVYADSPQLGHRSGHRALPRLPWRDPLRNLLFDCHNRCT